MAASLVTIDEMRRWPGLADVAYDDTFALAILEAASDKVRIAAGQPWVTRDSAPPRARAIAWHLACRSYLNPESVTREGVGPISEARSETLARALHLTTAEENDLAAMSPLAEAGALPGQKAGGTLWVQPLAKSTLVDDGDIIIGNIAYGNASDSFAFTPPAP